METVATGLTNPWALAFLPDGRLLVTERPGRMHIVGSRASLDGKLSPALTGVPKVFAVGQGGLHDVVLDRRYGENHTIYFCYAEPVDGGARTALARARLRDEDTPRLDEVKVIFRQDGPLSSGNHFGCRIAQTGDDNLFLTTGDHFSGRDQAQNLANHLGKLIRIRPDGSVPPDNPFVGRAGAKPEIWSYGHRNPQGLALNPATGKLWEHEHGPRGGDEINVIEKGKNYGWPVIGFGIDYNGARIHESTHKDGMEQPIWYWVPSIAPSGMAFAPESCSRPGAATCSSARWRGRRWCGSSSTARRSSKKSACCNSCASASATCAKVPTARSGSRPTAPTAGFCGSLRRSEDCDHVLRRSHSRHEAPLPRSPRSDK